MGVAAKETLCYKSSVLQGSQESSKKAYSPCFTVDLTIHLKPLKVAVIN